MMEFLSNVYVLSLFTMYYGSLSKYFEFFELSIDYFINIFDFFLL